MSTLAFIRKMLHRTAPSGERVKWRSVLILEQAVKASSTNLAVSEILRTAAAKLQLGLLEDIPLMSQDFLDKLGHIAGAVAQHVYEEEGSCFLDLKSKLSADVQVKLTQRYQEHYSRYVGQGSAARYQCAG